MQKEVAEMRANQAEWVKAEMLARLKRYGPRARWYVRINESAGAFQAGGNADYWMIQGY